MRIQSGSKEAYSSNKHLPSNHYKVQNTSKCVISYKPMRLYTKGIPKLTTLCFIIISPPSYSVTQKQAEKGQEKVLINPEHWGVFLRTLSHINVIEREGIVREEHPEMASQNFLCPVWIHSIPELKSMGWYFDLILTFPRLPIKICFEPEGGVKY